MLFVVGIDDVDANDTRQLLLAIVGGAISLIKARNTHFNERYTNRIHNPALESDNTLKSRMYEPENMC